MKWAYHIKHKIKAAFVLAIIILVILLGNLVIRERFSSIDKSMSSIYNDRLKPSAYLYDISHNIYQKRLLHNEDVNAHTSSLIYSHNKTIATLIGQYEQTVLTDEEKQQWKLFKQHLYRYNALENDWLKAGNEQMTTAANNELLAAFNLALKNLDNLSNIQVGEGNYLQRNTTSMVNSSLVFSSLEISLLIILGLFTLVILSVSDNAIFKQHQKQMLN